MVAYLLCVNANAYALAAENICAVLDKLRIFHSLRIDRHLVSASSQDIPDIINALYSSSDSKRNENLFRSFTYYVKEHSPALV